MWFDACLSVSFLRSTDTWRWTCQVIVCHLTILQDSFTLFLHMWQMYAELLTVCEFKKLLYLITSGLCMSNTVDVIRCGVPFKIIPTGLQWTKFSIISHSMGESHTWQTKQNVNDAPDSHILTPHCSCSHHLL